MNMTHPLPQCDCLNVCGDDSGVAAGTVSPCLNFAANEAEEIDNEAVAQFACALRNKLRDARAKGRRGWQDKALCSQLTLSAMLRAHVDKGDPRDVAAFAMFLWARFEDIAPAPPTADARELREALQGIEALGWLKDHACMDIAGINAVRKARAALAGQAAGVNNP